MSERIGPSALDLQIDRLVDGELMKRDYRALLTRLDEESDGWRRCALAFLEAQALRQDLPEVCRAVSATPSTVVRPARSSGSIGRYTALALTAAASLLCAFGLGWSLRSVPSALNRNRDVVTPRDVNVSQPSNQLAGSPATGELAGSDVPAPVWLAEEQDATWLTDDPAIVPADVQQALERLGYVIRRDRQWAPLESAGRQVFVPLEQVEIRPVSTHAY